MQLTVTNQGVPLGRAELTPAGFTVAVLSPLPAYSSVRGTIRSASEFLWRLGVLAAHSQAANVRLDPAALSRAASLPLELQDPTGANVTADYVNILEYPDPADPPLLVARFGQSCASVLAPKPIPPSEEDNRSSRPDV